MMSSAPSSLNSHTLKTLCGLVVTFVLLGWAIRDVSLVLVWSAITEARLPWLALSLAAFLASFAVRALRWGTLLRTYPEAGFSIRHSATFIGFAGNCLLPMRLGEIIRATVLHRYSKVPFATALGSIVVERALDAAVILIFFLISFPKAAQSSDMGLVNFHLGWLGTLVLTGATALFVISRWPAAVKRALESVSRVTCCRAFTSSRLLRAATSLLNGTDLFQFPKRAVRAIAEGFILWGLVASAYLFSMYSFGITSPGFIGAVFVSSIAALGIAIPSSPGHFGPFEAAVRLALGVYALPPDTIIAYALTLHFLMYASVTTIGLTLAVRLGVTWSEVVPPFTTRNERIRNE